MLLEEVTECGGACVEGGMVLKFIQHFQHYIIHLIQFSMYHLQVLNTGQYIDQQIYSNC